MERLPRLSMGFLVETMGLEPTTPSLQRRCSSQLSYVPRISGANQITGECWRNPPVDGWSVVFQRNRVRRDIHLRLVLGELNHAALLPKHFTQRRTARGTRPIELFVVLDLAPRAFVHHLSDTSDTRTARLDGARAPGTAYSRRQCRSRRSPPAAGGDRDRHLTTQRDECWQARW